MASNYPGALDDLNAAGLEHGDVSDALAAVQATLGVNPQSTARTITGARDFRSTAAFVGAHLDVIASAPFTGDPIPNSGIRYSVLEAAHDTAFRVGHGVTHTVGGIYTDEGSATITVDDDHPTGEPAVTQFNVVLPTAGASGDPADLLPTTAADLIAAFNGGPAAGRVVASLAPGHDGTGVVGLASVELLRGGAITPHVEIAAGIITSPVTIHPDELFETPLTLRPALGSTLGIAVLNIEPHDGSPIDPATGYGVSHLDSDGGGAFCGGRFAFSQNGNVRIDAAPGDNPLGVFTNGIPVFSTGGDYAALLAASIAPTQRGLSLGTATGQTADMVEGFNNDLGAVTFRVTPEGEVHASGGVVLTSPDGTAYRLIVGNGGALSTEAV